MKRLLSGIAFICLGLIITALLVIYAQGKRFGDGKITDTGVIQLTSTPTQAKVYLDGDLKGNSNLNIENVKPGDHILKLQKDHYSSWEKKITVQKGLVTPVSVSLFISNPSLTALTFNGIYAPKLSRDGKKVVYGIQNATNAGLWVADLADPNIFFSNTQRQVVADTKDYLFSKSTFSWSPDSSQILVEVQPTGSTQTKAFLLDQSQLNSSPSEITNNLEKTKAGWGATITSQQNSSLNSLGDTAKKLAVDAKKLKFSPDGKGVLIVKEDQTLVYDSKPSPVPGTKPATYNLPLVDDYVWRSGDSKHLILVDKNNLSIVDSDGTNQVGIFSGDFDPAAIFSWPDGSRLVISINLNSKANPLPNLYTIDLH